ncbi:MAG: SufE family protein [bacterium]
MSIDDAQSEIIEEFSFFDNWMDRYQYIIDLGKKLPDLDEKYKTDDNKLQGCQSQVWVIADKNGDHIQFHAISDSAIVSGLIALVLRVYSNRTAQEISATEPEFISKIGLSEHLSPTRSNGLHALLNWIKTRAASL